MAMFINNCKKLSLSSVRLLHSSSVASQIIAKPSSYESKMFPGFTVIYCLDSIKTVTLINRAKRTSSIIAAVICPVSYGFEVASMMPYSVAYTFVLSALSISLFFHTVGYFCNNTVGFIYAKKNTDDLVFSYLNYWGSRKDIKTTLSEVEYTESKNHNARLFNKLKIPSSKLSLKVYTKGQIIDEPEFYKLFGI